MRTSLWTICWSASLAVALLFPRPTSCLCLGMSFCEYPPDRADKNSAIFLSTVKQVLKPTAAPVAPGPPPDQPANALGRARRRPGDPAPRIAFSYPVVRLQVIENILGSEIGEFEVRLTSDHIVDGIPVDVPAFTEGAIWLVEAYRDVSDQRWTTSNCSRNKPVQQAQEELRVLRAWAAGQHLPARVTGEVWNPSQRTNLAGVQVYLRGDKQTRSTTTDSRGQFAFENLESGVYEATAVLPEGGGPVNIDLTRGWCRRVVFSVK